MKDKLMINPDIRIIYLLILIAISVGCSEKKTLELNLVGEVQGRVLTRNELTVPNEVHNGVEVKFVSENNEFKTETDSDGGYSLADIPTGVYDIYFSKEGFGYYPVFGKQIVGGGSPFIVYNEIIENSLTRIDDLSITTEGANVLKITGRVHHNYGEINSNNEPPYAYAFIGASNVSYVNYEHELFFSCAADSGSYFTREFIYNQIDFTKENNLYIVIYGTVSFVKNYSYEYDKSIVANRGVPTEIIKIN